MSASLQVHLSSSVALVGDAPAGFVDDLEAAFTLPNPKASVRPGVRRQFSREPATLSFCDVRGPQPTVPRGGTALVRSVADRNGVELQWSDHRRAVQPVPMACNRKLRLYQGKLVRIAIRRQQGVLVVPCGGGKTTTGLAIVAELGQPSLVLVHSLDLLEQWCSTIREVLAIEPAVCAEGAVSFGVVTVAMVQTVRAAPEWLAQAANYFGCVLVDECHHTAADSFRAVVGVLRARYLFGLTATPLREDGLSAVVGFYIGPVIAEVTHADLAAEGVSLAPKLRSVETAFAYPYSGPSDWPKLLNALAASPARNALVLDHVTAECRDGEAGLLLTGRVELANEYAADLRARGLRAAALTGATPKKVRAAAIEAARNGELDVLCATSLADEGLDIPRLSRVFLSFPARSEGRMIQRIGRILRPHPDKGAPLVVDFVDARVGVLRNQARIRRGTFEKTFGSQPTPAQGPA